MSGSGRMRVQMSVCRMLQRLPRLLVSGQVILLSLFGDAVDMGSLILQFGGSLVILVMRSVVVTS